MLAALESAHEFHQELTDPVRIQARIDAIIRAIRQARDGGIASAARSFTGGPSATRFSRRHGPVH